VAACDQTTPFDPWSDTTPGVSEVRDDRFDDWPTGSAMAPVHIATRASSPERRTVEHSCIDVTPAWVGGASLLLLIVWLIIVGIALTS
jgi:hypothetical protein